MRIAVWHNLPSGGGKRALHDHVKGLLARGHCITVFCPEGAEKGFLPFDRLGVEEIRLPYRKVVHKQTNGGLAQAFGQSRQILEQYRNLDEHCRLVGKEIACRGDFDILFVSSSLEFYMHPLGRYASIPSVFYLQEPYRFLFEARPRLPWEAIPDPVRTWYSPSYLRWYLEDVIGLHGKRVQLRNELSNARKYDQILVNSLYSRESVLRAYGIESEVCYLGVDTDKFSPQTETKKNYVISVGGLYPPKGADRIIRALGCVEKKIRPPLYWVGNFASSAYLDECKTLAGSLAVDFQFFSMVDDDELIRLLSEAMFMVYAPVLEPFGYAPLEANACGTPVVAVAEGGVRETVQHEINGLLSQSASPEIFSRQIERMIRDNDLRDRISRNCRGIVQDNWSVMDAAARLEAHLLKQIE